MEETLITYKTYISSEARFYTVKDLQEILGISRTAVYELIGQKQFPCLLIARKYRIPRKPFEAWMNGEDG